MSADDKYSTRHCDINISDNVIIGNNYLVTELLGEGSYSRVFACTDTETTSLKYAVKIYRGGHRYAYDDELRIMLKISEPNLQFPQYRNYITEYHGTFAHLCIDMTEKGPRSSIHPCITVGLYSTHLSDLIEHASALELSTAKSLFRQIMRGLVFLHANGIAHGDIKTTNIMIRQPIAEIESSVEQAQIVLVDFNHSIVYDKCDDFSSLGTQEYAAPERLFYMKWGPPADIWSAGCVFYEMITACDLFTLVDDDEETDEMNIDDSTTSANSSSETSELSSSDSSGFDFDTTYAHVCGIYQLLNKPPPKLIKGGRAFYSERGYPKYNPDIKQVNLREIMVKVHEFPQNIADSVMEFLLRMIKYTAKERDTAQKILDSNFLKEQKTTKSKK